MRALTLNLAGLLGLSGDHLISFVSFEPECIVL